MKVGLRRITHGAQDEQIEIDSIGARGPGLNRIMLKRIIDLN